jgi:hypothetical protein
MSRFDLYIRERRRWHYSANHSVRYWFFEGLCSLRGYDSIPKLEREEWDWRVAPEDAGLPLNTNADDFGLADNGVE